MKDIGANFHFLVFMFANVKDVKDSAPISQTTPIARFSTKLQESIIVRYITWTTDRRMQYHKKDQRFGFFLFTVIRNPHSGMVCVGPPKFQGNKVVNVGSRNAGGASSPSSLAPTKTLDVCW